MAPRKRGLSVVPEPAAEHDPPPDLRDAVDASVVAMTWLTKSDEAMVGVAKRLAAEIEQAADRAAEFDALGRAFLSGEGDLDAYKRLQRLEAMCSATKVAGWLGVQLQGVLRDLGGTPGVRQSLSESKRQVGGRLAQLRTAAGTSPESKATPPARPRRRGGAAAWEHDS